MMTHIAVMIPIPFQACLRTEEMRDISTKNENDTLVSKKNENGRLVHSELFPTSPSLLCANIVPEKRELGCHDRLTLLLRACRAAGLVHHGMFIQTHPSA
jgi:hypothetical protein